jgi:hypothetical protein
MGDIIDGKAMRLRMGGVAVTKATNCSITINRETRTRSHKDVSAGFQSNDYGTGSWEFSGEALYAEGESYETLFDAMIDKEKVEVEMSTNVSGTKKTTGDGVLTSLEMTAPDEEDTTYSFSGIGDGAPARATITP